MKKDTIGEVLEPLVSDIVSSNFDVFLASICTEDGFSLAHSTKAGLELEDDKIAALLSTFASISASSAQVFEGGDFLNSFVESEKSNLVVLRTQSQGLPLIIGLGASSRLSIAETRFHAQRLASRVAAL